MLDKTTSSSSPIYEIGGCSATRGLFNSYAPNWELGFNMKFYPLIDSIAGMFNRAYDHYIRRRLDSAMLSYLQD